MKENIGRLDQVLRVGISLYLIYTVFFDYSSLIYGTLGSSIIGGISIVGLFVAITRYCPLYKLVGLDTRQEQNN